VRASGVHDVALECDGANGCVCVCVSKLNRIGATVPLTGQAFGVFFLRGHISLKNRT
jgi:hypothetical protein